MRTAPLIVITIGMAVAGWFGGRWMRSQHDRPQPARAESAKPPAPKPLTREPHVDPNSPPGQWIARVRAATAADFPKLFDELQKLWPEKRTDNDIRESVVKWLLGRWIVVDADSAIAFVIGRDSESLKITFARLLGQLAPERAITLLDVSPPWLTEKLKSRPWHADTLRNQVMETLAESHPERFLELNRTGDADWRIARSTAVEALANRDPQAASAVFEELAADDPELRFVSPGPLMSAWCKVDSQAAREWAAKLKNPDIRKRAQVALFEAWAETDPRAAWRAFASDQPELVSESNSGQKSSDYFRASRCIISGLASVSVPEAFAAANSIVARLGESVATGTVSARFVGELREELITRLAEGAASSLPEAPGEFVATVDGLIESLRQPGNESGLHLLEKTLFKAKRSQWTSEQEFAAANILAATWNTDRASELLPKIVPLLESAIYGDASAVETAFFAFPADVQRALAGPLFEVASEDDENFEFAQKLAALTPPDDVTETTAEIMARHQPEAFAERMAALPPSKETIDAQAEFAWHWASRDPEAAVTWVETLPETGERRTVASRLTGSWADFDEAAAVAWASALPSGPLRDGAALGIASATAEFDPDGALQWAASINDPQTRIEAIVAAGRRQQESSSDPFRLDPIPETFISKVQALGLDPAEKAVALQKLRELDSKARAQ